MPQVNHAVQLAAQVGDTQKPGLRVRHRQQGTDGKDFAGRGQRHEQAMTTTFDRQPGALPRLGASSLQPLGKAVLQLAQRFAVGHSARARLPEER